MRSKVYRKLEELLEKKDMVQLHNELIKLHEFEIATFINSLEAVEAAIVFRLLPKSKAIDVFSYLDGDSQENLIEGFTDQEVSHVVSELAADDAVDMLEEMPAGLVSRVLKVVKPEKREILNTYLRYSEDSAGRLMNPDYLKLKKSQTVGEALNFIRVNATDEQILDTFYVTDETRILEGIVKLKQLVLSNDDILIGDIMDTEFMYINTDVDQEVVVHMFRDYDLLTLPVVDGEKRLLGFITVDDAFDAMQEETTEDFEKMAGMSPSERPYLKTSVFKHARSRVTWLLVLMISGILNGTILGKFEHAFIAMPILVTFIPMLTDTGGNAGSQSSTMIIRGMALNELGIRNIGSILWKELRISLLVGVVLAVVNFIRIYIMHPEMALVALVVSLAMICIVILAKILGCTLPIIAKAFGLDPAIMAAPLITTIVDAVGLIAYFLVAEAILKI